MGAIRLYGESNIVSVLTDCVIIVPVCEYMFVDSGQRVTVSERGVLSEYNVHVHTCKCRVTNDKLRWASEPGSVERAFNKKTDT